MTKTLSFVSSLIVATLLVWPSAADAQAARRGGSDSGGSSGGASSGSRGGSDSGGSVAVPRHSPPPPPVRTEPGESRSTGSRGGRVSSRPAGDAPAARVQQGDRSDGVDSASRRLRTNQAVRGTAQPRGDRPLPGDGSDYWYPWYYTPGYYYSSPRSYYGYDPWFYGPMAYSPWLYGAWSWNAYGWNDPFFYDPYGWYGGGGGTSSYDNDADEGEATGSIRLRVNPDAARVYVDGALAGEASEFGGFSSHLTLPEGDHQIELRAEGYESRTIDVTVKAGRTQTERVNLKKTE